MTVLIIVVWTKRRHQNVRSRQRNTKRHRQQIHLYFYGSRYVESEVAIGYDCFWLHDVRVKTLEGLRSAYDWNWLQRGTTFRDSEDVYFPLHITPIISEARMEARAKGLSNIFVRSRDVCVPGREVNPEKVLKRLHYWLIGKSKIRTGIVFLSWVRVACAPC